MRKITTSITNFCGIDTIRSIIPTYTLEKFMSKHNLVYKQKVSKKIKDISEKELKKVETKYVKYAYLDNDSIMIVISRNKELDELCVKRKKKYTYYSYVIITSLHQPQRKLNKARYKIASLFIKRFKIINCDVALDYKVKKYSIMTIRNAFLKNCEKNLGSKDIYHFENTVYANNCNIHNISKIKNYDKYKKETEYHKKKLPLDFFGWSRLETTININNKLKKITNLKLFKNPLFFMAKLIRSITRSEKTWGINQIFFKKQLRYLFDNRYSLKGVF